MKKTVRRRNPLHNHPLLHKGGVHRQSNKSRRRLDKIRLKKEHYQQNAITKVCFADNVLLFSHI